MNIKQCACQVLYVTELWGRFIKLVQRGRCYITSLLVLPVYCENGIRQEVLPLEWQVYFPLCSWNVEKHRGFWLLLINGLFSATLNTPFGGLFAPQIELHTYFREWDKNVASSLTTWGNVQMNVTIQIYLDLTVFDCVHLSSRCGNKTEGREDSSWAAD